MPSGSLKEIDGNHPWDPHNCLRHVWPLGKSWGTAMPRAPSRPEFTIHYFKNLNWRLLDRRSWQPLAFKEPYKCLREAWVLGAAEMKGRSRWWNSFTPQGASFSQTHPLSPYFVPVTAPPALLEAPWLSRKTRNTEHGRRGASLQPSDPGLLRFPGPKRVLWAALPAAYLWEGHPSPQQRGLLLALMTDTCLQYQLGVLHIVIHLILTTNLWGNVSAPLYTWGNLSTGILSDFSSSHTSGMPFDPTISLLGINYPTGMKFSL